MPNPWNSQIATYTDLINSIHPSVFVPTSPGVSVPPEPQPQPDTVSIDYETAAPANPIHWDSSHIYVSPSYIEPSSGNSYKKRIKPVKSNDAWYNIPLIEYCYKASQNKQDGEVGLEIECEGTHLFDSPIQYWVTHNDGSLRVKNNHPPIEYVLKKPLSREDVTKALRYLSNQLKRAGSSVDLSPRTSVHVHLNMQQWTIKEIFTFICLYLIFENVLVEYSGPTRKGNLFCLSAKYAEYWIWTICQMFQNDGDLEQVCNDDNRYTSCNTASLTKFGSLEFRSMRGTVDIELIQTWVNLLTHIKDESKNFSDPAKLYEDFINLGAWDFFKTVFYNKKDLYNILLNTAGSIENLTKGMEEGSVFVRDIAQSIPRWEARKPKEEKKKPAKQLVTNRVARFQSAWSNGTKIYNPGGSQIFPTPFGPQPIPLGNYLVWDDEGLICFYDASLSGTDCYSWLTT